MISAARAIELQQLITKNEQLGTKIDTFALTIEEQEYCIDWIKYCMEYPSAKSEKKKEVMNKYLVITTGGVAQYCKDLVEAKESATEAVLAGRDEVYVYELKMTAGVVKPKVEFKEV